MHAPDPSRSQPAYYVRLNASLGKIALAAKTDVNWRQDEQPGLQYCSGQKTFSTENLKKEQLLLLLRLHVSAIKEVSCLGEPGKILQLSSIARCNPPVRSSPKTNRLGFFKGSIT
jgi:hypothetical protein